MKHHFFFMFRIAGKKMVARGFELLASASEWMNIKKHLSEIEISIHFYRV